MRRYRAYGQWKNRTKIKNHWINRKTTQFSIFSKFQKSNFGLVLSIFVIFVKLVQSGVGFSIPAYNTINACSRIMVLALI
jgi:hypothetical protein